MRHSARPCPHVGPLRNTRHCLRRSRAHAVASEIGTSVASLKEELREATQAGRWNSSTRGKISKLQVELEGNAPDLHYEKLKGLWKLIFTTAPDVAPLMTDQRNVTARLPFQPQVSAIYQRFTSEEEGIVQNIVQFGDGLFFDKQKGATFVVNAAWFKSSGLDRTIELTFESAQLCALNPTSSLEAVLAPPVLPRTSLQHKLLLGLAEFDVRVRLPTASNLRQGNPATGKYMLTYCDEDMLIGRAQVGGGVFIFDKEESSLW